MQSVDTKPLGENEYLVHVGYDMPRDKAKLENEFSLGGVSKLFCGDYVWLRHTSCLGIEEVPRNCVMLLKDFGRDTMSESNIREMDEQGYRPATHLEAYAFAKANPEPQRQFWIVALGSFMLYGEDGRYVAVLCSDSGRRGLDGCWFYRQWDSYCRFLFVRK